MLNNINEKEIKELIEESIRNYYRILTNLLDENWNRDYLPNFISNINQYNQEILRLLESKDGE